jgi:preprotein translocase subunit SecF
VEADPQLTLRVAGKQRCPSWCVTIYIARSVFLCVYLLFLFAEAVVVVAVEVEAGVEVEVQAEAEEAEAKEAEEMEAGDAAVQVMEAAVEGMVEVVAGEVVAGEVEVVEVAAEASNFERVPGLPSPIRRPMLTYI